MPVKRGPIFIYGLTLTAVFFVVLQIAHLTPMQSDDFNYYFKGLTLDAHLHHYMTWSGRALADYISCGILVIDNHFAKAIINTMGILLLLYTTASIPPQFERLPATSKTYIFLIIFLLYWLSNATLSQSTFWIVGSANYVWTNIFIAVYIKYALRYCLGSKTRKNILLCLVIGAFAGATNENTAILLPFITVAFMGWERYTTGKMSWTPLLFILATIAGLLVLLLSPGNIVRAQSEQFAWYQLSFAKRLMIHLGRRMPTVLGRCLPVFAVLALTLFSCRKVLAKKIECYGYVLLFTGCAVTAGLVMVVAPAFPRRTANGVLFFLLVALAFALVEANMHTLVFKRVQIAVTCLLLAFFAPSYYFMYTAYTRTMIQDTIRTDIIVQAKAKGKQTAEVPRFFNPPVFKSGDGLDVLHHSSYMGVYYGIDTVTAVPASFDYSVIKRAAPVKINNAATVQTEKTTSQAQTEPESLYLDSGFFSRQVKFVFVFADAGLVRMLEKQSSCSLDVIEKKSQKMQCKAYKATVSTFGGHSYVVCTVDKKLLSSVDALEFSLPAPTTDEKQTHDTAPKEPNPRRNIFSARYTPSSGVLTVL